MIQNQYNPSNQLSHFCLKPPNSFSSFAKTVCAIYRPWGMRIHHPRNVSVVKLFTVIFLISMIQCRYDTWCYEAFCRIQGKMGSPSLCVCAGCIPSCFSTRVLEEEQPCWDPLFAIHQYTGAHPLWVTLFLNL